jgi:sugar/nucleoside kinase (ribokinase family)
MTIPDYLVIGHVTRDLLPAGGTAPGGTALYAAVTVQHLGLQVGILTAAEELPEALDPSVLVTNIPTPHSSTFENRYTPAGRQQWLHAEASALRLDAMPAEWRKAPLVHLGPVLHECDLTMLEAFPQARVVATPQGWMRVWPRELPAQIGRVNWQPDPELLKRLSLVVLSVEDVGGDEAIAAGYARHCELVALTRGKEGATLFIRGVQHAIAARPSVERDPTGAGDVFAAALLVGLHETGDPIAAANFAAQIAGASVEGPGISAIPKR